MISEGEEAQVRKVRERVERILKTGLRTRSVINLSNVWVNARDAISLWSALPQFLESDSASVSEYSCTFAFR